MAHRISSVSDDKGPSNGQSMLKVGSLTTGKFSLESLRLASFLWACRDYNGNLRFSVGYPKAGGYTQGMSGKRTFLFEHLRRVGEIDPTRFECRAFFSGSRTGYRPFIL